MLVRRARTLLKHWSAQPSRTAVLFSLAALLAFAGPLGCWLHCHTQAHTSQHSVHGHATALAEWARPPAEQQSTATHVSQLQLADCVAQHSDPSALTVGILMLGVLLLVPRPRRRPAFVPALRWLPYHRAPLFPPPRFVLDAPAVR